jgi:hypothetical protein
MGFREEKLRTEGESTHEERLATALA